MKRLNIVLKEDNHGSSILFPVYEEFNDDYLFPILNLDCGSLETPVNEIIPLLVWGDPGIDYIEYTLTKEGKTVVTKINDEPVSDNRSAFEILLNNYEPFEDPDINTEYKNKYSGIRVKTEFGSECENDVFHAESELQKDMDFPVGGGYPFWAQSSPVSDKDNTEEAVVNGDYFIAEIEEGLFFGYFFYYYNPDTRIVKAYFQCT